MHLTALDNLSFPTRLASSASLCCFTQAAAQGRPGTVTQAPGTCCDTSPAPQVWHNRYCCPRPFKTLWNHPRSLCQKKKKSDILSIFLRQHKTVLSWGRCSLYPLCSPDPPAKQEAQHYPATTDPTVSVCLLWIFYHSSDLFHQAAAWWTEPKEMRACMQEGISISQIPEFGVF